MDIYTDLCRLRKLENVYAVMKIAAIFMFIVIAILALTGIIEGNLKVGIPQSAEDSKVT